MLKMDKKVWQRTTALSLSLGLVFSSLPAAGWAAENSAATQPAPITQERAVELAKKYIGDPQGFKLFDASYQESKEGMGPYRRGSVWMINFGPEDRYKGGSIHIVLDGKNGELVNLDFYNQDDSSIEKSISKEEAKEKAWTFLKQYASDKAEEVKELQLPTLSGPYSPWGLASTMQTFRFARVVNGILFPTDNIIIRVNGKGELRGFTIQWSDGLSFPDAKPSLTEDEAKDAFKNGLDLQLQYQIDHKPYGGPSKDAILTYALPGYQYGPYRLPLIDAVNGGVIGTDGKAVEAKPPISYKPLQDQPGQPKATGEITKDVAMKLISSYNVKLEGYELEHSSYQQFEESQPIWRFEYRKGEPKDYRTMSHVSVSIDAKSGELREMYRNEYQEGPQEFPKNPALSKEEAQQKAIAFLKQAVPTKADRIALASTPSDPYMTGHFGSNYQFYFAYLVNGLPFREANIRIGIDPNTGEVREYFGNTSMDEQMKFPSEKGAMNLEKAKERYLQKYPLSLQYVPIYEEGKPPYDPGQPKGAALVYTSLVDEPFEHINAITGESISEWGGKVPRDVEIEDIKGHWAEKQIKYFADQGIFEVKEGKVHADQIVSRGDMLKYLVMSIQGPRRIPELSSFEDVPKTDPNFEYIEEAAARKWIDRDKKLRPNDPMTREELADLVNSILGFSKLSEARETFKNKYADVSSGSQFFGDIAIVSALGIMTGNQDRFSPKQQITKAQAAVVITKILDQLKEKQGYPYYW